MQCPQLPVGQRLMILGVVVLAYAVSEMIIGFGMNSVTLVSDGYAQRYRDGERHRDRDGNEMERRERMPARAHTHLYCFDLPHYHMRAVYLSAYLLQFDLTRHECTRFHNLADAGGFAIAGYIYVPLFFAPYDTCIRM